MFAVKHFVGHLGLGTHEPDLDELNSLDRYLRGWSCIGTPSSLYALIQDLSLSIYRNISLHINIYICGDPSEGPDNEFQLQTQFICAGTPRESLFAKQKLFASRKCRERWLECIILIVYSTAC